MIDMKDRPSYLQNQQLSHRRYHHLWLQRVGLKIEPAVIVLLEATTFVLILALAWLMMFL